MEDLQSCLDDLGASALTPNSTHSSVAVKHFAGNDTGQMKLVAAALIVNTLALVACSHDAEVRDGRDLVVKDSLDGRFRAQLREMNIDGSVMVSQPYQVVPTSLVHRNLKPTVMLMADKTAPMELAWEPPATLFVCYYDAQIFDFRNTFVSATEGDPRLYQAEVVLRKLGESDRCGGDMRTAGIR